MGSNPINHFGTLKDQNANLFDPIQPLEWGYEIDEDVDNWGCMAANRDWELESHHKNGTRLNLENWAPQDENAASLFADSILYMSSDPADVLADGWTECPAEEFFEDQWKQEQEDDMVFTDYMELSASRSVEDCDDLISHYGRNHYNREWSSELGKKDNVRSNKPKYLRDHTRRRCNKRETIRRLSID